MDFAIWPLLNGMFALRGSTSTHSTCGECWCAAVNMVKKEKHRNKLNCSSDMLHIFFSRLSSYLVKKNVLLVINQIMLLEDHSSSYRSAVEHHYL